MLKNRHAIITGSTSGIGLAMAHALAEQGAHLMINGIMAADEAESLCNNIAKKHDVSVLFSSADLSKTEQAVAMIKSAEQSWGKVDILINNAGIQHTSPIESFPAEKWDMVLSTNLSAQFHTIRTVLEGMKQRNFGRIINIASAHGLVASVHKCAYIAAKHGVVGLTKAVALEAAEFDITCNAICPGWVLTPLVQKQIDDRAASNKTSVELETKTLVGEKQPNKRFSTPEDIAAMALFLANPAFKAATGTCFSVDGGWTAW